MLAVNYFPPEKEDVMPFIKQHHYTFTPVETPTIKWMPDWQHDMNLQSTNYLIDSQGRAVFTAHFTGQDVLQTVENEIDLLLSKE